MKSFSYLQEFEDVNERVSAHQQELPPHARFQKFHLTDAVPSRGQCGGVTLFFVKWCPQFLTEASADMVVFEPLSEVSHGNKTIRLILSRPVLLLILP